MVEHLRTNKTRITPQRLAILEVIAESKDHPSVEQIYEKLKLSFPTMSIATVYKTVALLKSINEVLEIKLPGNGNRYDGMFPMPHPHLVCVKCGKIVDPQPPNLSGLMRQVSADTGFQVVGHQLSLFGICPECQQKTKGIHA